MLKLYKQKAFKKSLKKYKYNDVVLNELEYIVELLVTEQEIPNKYKDHELKGKFHGIRELHLKPDDLLLSQSLSTMAITL
jgi:mRNA interferase YafQ